MRCAAITPSLVCGTASYLTSAIVFAVGAWQFDDATAQRIVLATLISASGGLGVALTPVGESSWTWLGFMRLVLLGALVGPPTSIALGDPRLAFIGAARPWVLMGVGALAYPIFVAIQKGGPAKFFSWVWRLRTLQPPPPPAGGGIP